ncbi:MAG: murein biosynthesis integral membrane protein MurJ [Thermodesulfobacteriota bacterium]|nr:murein biosynthesis integral membrane protein MurJ [Thermodesulfobacteriota bacterium]
MQDKMRDSNDTKILKKSRGIGFAMLASRILGVIRDAVIAMLFGAGFYSDAFFLTFRIPDFMRKSFSDGVLSISFVPVFTEYITEKGRTEAFAMARSAFFLTAFVSGLIVAAGIVSAPAVLKMTGAGTGVESCEFDLIVRLMRIMMPYLFCIFLMAVCMGIMNGLGSFTPSALAPVILNLVIIFSGFALSPFFDPPVLALAVGVLAGGILQLAWQMFFAGASGFVFWRSLKLFYPGNLVHPGAVKAAKMFFPAVIGASSYQINLLVVTMMAATLLSGSVSYLYYADRLVQFPLALFTVSVSIVLLPELAKTIASEKEKAACDLFKTGGMLVLFITIPSMAGLLVLREPVVSLLFCRGAFGAAAVKETSETLVYLIFGLWAFAGTRLFVTLFYAFSNVKIPFRAGVAAVAVNLVLSFCLINVMGHKGLAMAVSFAAMANFFFLFASALPRLKKEIVQTLFWSGFRALVFSGIMYAAVNLMFFSVLEQGGPDNGGLFAKVVICVFLGVFVYLGCALVVQTPEIKILKNLIHRKKEN